jgi:hypothetical protein
MLKSAFLLVFALSAAFPAKDISLRYNLRNGDQFELRQKTDQKMIQTIMGMDQTGNNAYDGTIAMRVISTDQERVRIEAKMTHLKSHLKNIMNEIDLDSDGDTKETSTQIVQAMMNQPFYVTLSKNGVIEKVEDVDNLWKGVDKLDLPDEDKKQVKAAIGQMINESSFKNGLGQAFLTYAGKPVQPLETWTTQNGIPADFPVRSDNKWFVQSTTASHAVVSGEGIFKTIDKEKVVSLPGDLKAKVNLEGTQKVNGTSALKTGLPDKVAIEAKLSGVIVLLAGGMLPMDIKVPITIDTHTEYTFVRK